MMDLDETALLSEQHLEQSLIRLREEERQLIEQQSVMEAGAYDDIAALEHQDALRLNHLQQQKVQRQQAAHARFALRQQQRVLELPSAARREPTARRRVTCNVRVNHLHAIEAIETDV